MTIPLSQQIECAREVLAKMRANRSLRIKEQEAIVATLERQEMFRQVSDEMKGAETREVELV
jgi:hypothetical protein